MRQPIETSPKSPYPSLVAIGAEIESHESDLYVRATLEARRIVYDSGFCFSIFHDKAGEPWIEVPFAFDPFWRQAR